jgi:hypothetical protein
VRTISCARRQFSVIEGFRTFASGFDLDVDLDQRMYAGGLCFIAMRSPRDIVESLAQYSFVRVIRRMASLSLNESILRTSGMPGRFIVTLPKEPPMNPDIRVAVFDGGISEANNPVSTWVRAQDAPGVGASGALSGARLGHDFGFIVRAIEA